MIAISDRVGCQYIIKRKIYFMLSVNISKMKAKNALVTGERKKTGIFCYFNCSAFCYFFYSAIY